MKQDCSSHNLVGSPLLIVGMLPRPRVMKTFLRSVSGILLRYSVGFLRTSWRVGAVIRGSNGSSRSGSKRSLRNSTVSIFIFSPFDLNRLTSKILQRVLKYVKENTIVFYLRALSIGEFWKPVSHNLYLQFGILTWGIFLLTVEATKLRYQFCDFPFEIWGILLLLKLV